MRLTDGWLPAAQGDALYWRVSTRERMHDILRRVDPFVPIPRIGLEHVLGHLEHSWEGPSGDAWIAVGGTLD